MALSQIIWKHFPQQPFCLSCGWQAWDCSSLSLPLIAPYISSFTAHSNVMWVTVCVITFSFFPFVSLFFYILLVKSKDSIKQALSLQPKSQNSYKRLKSSASSSLTQHKHLSDTLSSHLMSLPHINDTNLFLSHHLNGMIHGAVQDAPLALITKPRSQSSTPCSKPPLVATSPPCPMPINLSTGSSGSSDSTPKSSASPGVVHRQRKSNTPKFLPGKSLSKSSTSCPPADLVRGSESDIHSSRDSDDSLGDDFDDDDDDDDVEDEDSGSSLSGKIKQTFS